MCIFLIALFSKLFGEIVMFSRVLAKCVMIISALQVHWSIMLLKLLNYDTFLNVFFFFIFFLRISNYGMRIFYYVKELEPILDSSNMSMVNWTDIASDIQTYYKDFDAFVILHGTDTLAYTASALSFMLENLGKTVILTGAQVRL